MTSIHAGWLWWLIVYGKNNAPTRRIRVKNGLKKCLITKKNNACIHTKEIRAYYCYITFFDKSNVKNVSFTVIIPLVISFSAVRFLIKISFHTIPLHYNLNVSTSLPLDQVRQTRKSSQCILEFTKYLRLRFFFRGISQRR